MDQWICQICEYNIEFATYTLKMRSASSVKVLISMEGDCNIRGDQSNDTKINARIY